jgi:hypothetical protein
MGYALNELANLPVDDSVNFYIFAINGTYREPLYDMISSNFINIARQIGSNAVIAIGTNSEAFTTSVAKKYIGSRNSDRSFTDLLPALLITNCHPDKLTKDSMRLIVPLRDAEARFGGWSQFFSLLAQFVRGENEKFIECFEKQEDFIEMSNKIVQLKPNFFGLGININEFVDQWRKRRAQAR